MKAAVFKGVGTPLQVETLDDPEAGAGEVVIRVGRCGVCGTDLHMTSGWKRRPDALRRPVVAPLIITGIVRSGTTAVHKLMAIDPQFQGLEHWITRAPQPRPPRDRWSDIAAYRHASAVVQGMIAAAPEMEADHMMSADEVEESLFLLPQSFTSNIFPSQWDIATYDRWYRRQDETPSYARCRADSPATGSWRTVGRVPP